MARSRSSVSSSRVAFGVLYAPRAQRVSGEIETLAQESGKAITESLLGTLLMTANNTPLVPDEGVLVSGANGPRGSQHIPTVVFHYPALPPARFGEQNLWVFEEGLSDSQLGDPQAIAQTCVEGLCRVFDESAKWNKSGESKYWDKETRTFRGGQPVSADRLVDRIAHSRLLTGEPPRTAQAYIDLVGQLGGEIIAHVTPRSNFGDVGFVSGSYRMPTPMHAVIPYRSEL